MSISDNIKRIRDEIADAAISAGRSPDEIMLVAATKTTSANSVREAIAAGIDACGENRVQEMLEKHSAGAFAGAPLHFIGHLQKNKVKHVVGTCDLIESVDSAELLSLISERAASMGIIQDVLIEINIAREEAKSGIMVENLTEILEHASQLSGVLVKGLMSIPPILVDLDKSRKYFDTICNLFVDIRAKKYDNVIMQFLSMGMSNDFVAAIASGSNVVRIGTAIFGERKYN